MDIAVWLVSLMWAGAYPLLWGRLFGGDSFGGDSFGGGLHLPVNRLHNNSS